MDGVALFFAGPTSVEVAHSAARLGVGSSMSERTPFLFNPYPEWRTECEKEEIENLTKCFEEQPSCAFVLFARHGKDARLALEFAAKLMSEHPRSALDNDFGELWSQADVIDHFHSSKNNDLYTLRNDNG